MLADTLFLPFHFVHSPTYFLSTTIFHFFTRLARGFYSFVDAFIGLGGFGFDIDRQFSLIHSGVPENRCGSCLVEDEYDHGTVRQNTA